MVITHVMGGIGNQLFQYATARKLAHKLNTELKLEIFQCEAEKFSHHNYYRLGDFNIAENFATQEEIQHAKLINEKDYTFDDVLNLPDNIYLYGYWGNSKYFEDVREILLKELTLKNPLGNMSSYWQAKILSAKNPVSLHVRCGDFLTPNVRNSSGSIPQDYYFECVNRLKEIYPDFELFVFSDDLDFVKKFFKFDMKTNFVEDCEKDCEELYLMSICKHNIIPFSTFAWWGAWLNQNPDKKVFVPTLQNRNDFYPENWIRISADFKKKSFEKFQPFLSIIIYVENNLDSMQITIPSFFDQNFKDYEIIIADPGMNNFCRKFATDDRVTYLKIDETLGKFEAWNLGIENARGENILFMTSKGFIVRNAIHSLAENFYGYLKSIEPQNKYLTHGNYYEIFPDIICATRILEGNISDKNFSVKTDESFKNLSNIIEIKIDDSQKLIGLATQQINNSLATKFFKRKFLLENKIRFKNNVGGGGITFSCRKFHEYR